MTRQDQRSVNYLELFLKELQEMSVFLFSSDFSGGKEKQSILVVVMQIRWGKKYAILRILPREVSMDARVSF